MTEKNRTGDAMKFDYVVFHEIDKLESHHPLVHNLSPGDEHRPTHFRALSSCPDTNDDFPCYYYLHINDRIVSSFAALPDRLFVGGDIFRWAWAGALLTDAAFRGKGLGTLIIEEAVKVLRERNIAWGGVFSTPAALHVYDKLDFTMPGFANRYLMLKSMRMIFDYHLKSRLLAFSADFIYRAAIRTFLALKNRAITLKGSNVRAVKIDVNNYSQSCKQPPELHYHTKYHFNDSMPKLKWKVMSSGFSTLYIMEDHSTSTPLCYFVLKKRPIEKPMLDKYKDFTLMTLMDFGMYHSDESIHDTLLRLVLNMFWKSDADVLEVISSSNLLNSSADRMGMKKVGRGMSYVYSAPPHWNIDSGADCPEKWPLTHYCGDAFSFA